MRAQACTLHVSAPPHRLISVRRLNVVDGTLTLLCVVDEIAGLMNPAFSRCHPRMPVLYACTESVKEEGLVRSRPRVCTRARFRADFRPLSDVESECYLCCMRASKL